MKINFRLFFKNHFHIALYLIFTGLPFLKSFHENRVLWFLHFDYILHIPEYQRDLIRVPYSYSVLDSPIEHVPKMRHFAWDSFKSKVITEVIRIQWHNMVKNEQRSVIDSIKTNEWLKMNIEKWKPMKIKFKIEMSF